MRAVAAIWLGCLAGFIGLAVRAATRGVLSVDVSIARWVQKLPDIAGALFALENWLGDGWPLALVTVGLAAILLWRGRRDSAALVFLTFLPRALDTAVKQLVGEPRPSDRLVQVDFPHDNVSFPSGHVIGVTLVFVLAIALASRLSGSRVAVALVRGLAVLFIATIGLARIWVGAHWPSDVLGGYLYASLFLIPALLWLRTRDSKREPSRVPVV